MNQPLCTHQWIFSGRPSFRIRGKSVFQGICSQCKKVTWKEELVSGHANPDLDDKVDQDLFAKLAGEVGPVDPPEPPMEPRDIANLLADALAKLNPPALKGAIAHPTGLVLILRNGQSFSILVARKFEE